MVGTDRDDPVFFSYMDQYGATVDYRRLCLLVWSLTFVNFAPIIKTHTHRARWGLRLSFCTSQIIRLSSVRAREIASFLPDRVVRSWKSSPWTHIAASAMYTLCFHFILCTMFFCNDIRNGFDLWFNSERLVFIIYFILAIVVFFKIELVGQSRLLEALKAVAVRFNGQIA